MGDGVPLVGGGVPAIDLFGLGLGDLAHVERLAHDGGVGGEGVNLQSGFAEDIGAILELVVEDADHTEHVCAVLLEHLLDESWSATMTTF